VSPQTTPKTAPLDQAVSPKIAHSSKPLLKAAWIMAKADGYAKASLLRAYSKEPHLLAAVRDIADRNA
jgi:hypothetical protein